MTLRHGGAAARRVMVLRHGGAAARRVMVLRHGRALLLGALLAAGCMVGPDYHPPRLDAPAQWGETADGEAAGAMSAEARAALAAWWNVFGDDELGALVQRAAASNLDLQQAAARVRQARALRTIATGTLWPNVTSQDAYEHAHTSGNTLGAPDAVGKTFDLYQVGFDASWELDVFGGNRRAVEAADATLEAARLDWASVLVSLLGEVGSGYMTYRSLQQRIAIANENVATQQKTLDLTRRLFAAGLATELDVSRAEAQVATTAATIPTLTIQARDLVHVLGVLLGEPPMTLSLELEAPRGVPRGPSLVEVGLPSELLERRPDVRRSERQLAAATAEIGVATRDLYPRFFVTGFAALESINASTLFDWSSRAASIGPSISWTVFDAGITRATVTLRDAQQQEQLAGYRATVLQAFQEVEDALVAYAQEQKRYGQLVSATTANQRAADLALSLYVQGLTDFLSVLQAQLNLFVSQDALRQSEGAIASDLVALYKALGGGWEAVTLPDGASGGPAAG